MNGKSYIGDYQNMNKNVVELIKKPIKKGRNVFFDLRAAKYLSKTSKDQRNSEIIRIAFIVQMAEIWDKEIDVYEELTSRENIETVLLVVPPYNFSKSQIGLSYDNNYFIEKFPNAIKAVNPDGSVIDIKKMNLNYVFYQRPYDHYLPQKLRSSEVVKYCRCCYIPYGFSGADTFNGGNTNDGFFRNMTFIFQDSDYMKSVHQNKFNNRIFWKYQHNVSLGYPSLVHFFDLEKRSKIKTIMWTPRWNYDNRIGGSHFFEYKDAFLEIKKQNPNVKLIFRPHPLMFDEFVKKNLMEQEEVEDYKSTLAQLDIVYDHDSLIIEAFNDSDLLITDFSSIIINYFLTGKPIIYCKAQYDLNPEYSKIASCMYIAENEDQLKKYCQMLLNGNDPLAENRTKVIEQFRAKHFGAEKRIVDYLVFNSINH